VSDSFYTSRSVIRKVRGVHRLARLEAGAEAEMGVHGAIKEHYNIDSPDLPLPVDYIVAATGT
jgi:hypothetical protein